MDLATQSEFWSFYAWVKHPRSLRLTQTSLGNVRYRAEVALGPAAQARKAAACTPKLSERDREDLRWYSQATCNTR
jgi:hypothetical protein